MGTNGDARRIRPLTPARLAVLPRSNGHLTPTGWTHDVIAAWGHCGMVAEHDGVPIGYLLAAPAALVPQVGPYATSPVGPDAGVLLAASVVPHWTRQGIGRQLVQGLAADLVRRKVAAIEAVGGGDAHPSGFVLPEGWLAAVGFRLERDHPLTPRYRMDLSATLRWRPQLSAAWGRVRALVGHAAPPPEPAHLVIEQRSDDRHLDGRLVLR